MSALQIVLGIGLVASGIGYGLYVQVILPITIALVGVKCGLKVSGLTGINTLVILAVSFGNLGLAVYGIQALGFGLLTGELLKKSWQLKDDLLIASLTGCLFLLILDYFTAHLLGVSLLDHDEAEQMILELWPQINPKVMEAVYYLSIASVPVSSVLITYMGSLILGYRLGYLKGEAFQKYYFIRYYKRYVSMAYHQCKMIRWAVVGLIIQYLLWPYVAHPYGRAWIATSGAILLYFILMDFTKLIGQFILEKSKQALCLPIYQVVLWFSFFNAFKWTCCFIMIVGSIIDFLTTIRLRQTKQLIYGMQRAIKGY